MKFIDTHAHLDFKHFEQDRDEVITKARDTGVRYIVNVGADLQSSRRSIELAGNYNNIFATVGVHPHDADKVNRDTLTKLEKLAADRNVLAIGEIGLDYHYDNSPRDLQKKVFKEQLQLASKLELPVVIHSREAEEETLKIIQEMNIDKYGGIMHCFGYGLDMAERCLEHNLYLAFGGVITFKNAENLRTVVKNIPLKKILIETDCPYLTPDPYRGKRNQPAYVKLVAEEIAEIKNISLKEVAEKTTENAFKVYNIKKG